MMPGVDDAVILSEQFLPRIFGNRAKLVVNVGDFSLRVGDGHDGMLVQSRFQFAEFTFGAGTNSAVHSFVERNRSALAMTDTELRLIAAPAKMGLNKTVNTG